MTGTIVNFRDAGGASIDGNWVVNLNRRNGTEKNIGTPTATATMQGHNARFSGVTDGGPLGASAGSWAGIFTEGGGGLTDDDPRPSGAMGTFDGHFSNGHVRGAFVVEKQGD